MKFEVVIKAVGYEAMRKDLGGLSTGCGPGKDTGYAKQHTNASGISTLRTGRSIAPA